MSRRLRTERGSALVIAMFAIAVMLMIGLATYSFVDAQTGQANREHVGESSFRLANAALNEQMFKLGSLWPNTSATAYPASCASGGAGTSSPTPQADASARAAASFQAARARLPIAVSLREPRLRGAIAAKGRRVRLRPRRRAPAGAQMPQIRWLLRPPSSSASVPTESAKNVELFHARKVR